MKRKYHTKKKVLLVILIISIIVFCYSLFNILDWKSEEMQIDKINGEIDENININPDDGVFEINLDKLKKINPDTIGYIYINNTNISYPIVQTKNNNFYLTHDFYKKENEAGWIYMDYRSSFNSKNAIIYGHNRLDGIMFGSLKNVLKESWYSEPDNLIIHIVTKEGEIGYKIFSVYKIKKESYYITPDMTDKEYKKFIDTLTKRSIHNFNSGVTSKSKIITLSTCTKTDNERLVVHAYQL